MKVLICDYTGNSAQWIEEFVIKENLEVVGTITSATDKNLLAEKSSWEYLLIFEQGNKKFFMSLAHFMNIPPQRVIFALDWKSWAEHPAAMYTLLNPTRGAVAYRILHFNTARQFNYFTSCTTADGLHYVATSKDDTILRTMYIRQKTWSEESIKLFKNLTQKFYDVDDSEGLFLDLGANIGTTGIYFLKKFAPNLKLLAFEPDPENFKLLRTNLILNDVENFIVENYGLGDEETEMTMYKAPWNPGANRFFRERDDQKTEIIKIIPLDKYFAEKNISAKDVKYIWIDTEGFEAQVLLGMKNILTENQAPVFLEFNPQRWQETGYYEKMIDFLKELYEGYIWTKEYFQTKNIKINKIEDLIKFQNSTDSAGFIGDIFLIHELKDEVKGVVE